MVPSLIFSYNVAMMLDLSFLETVPLPHDAVEVARIGQAWGVRGGFKVYPHSSQPEAILACDTWLVQLASTSTSQHSTTWLLPIHNLKLQKEVWLAQSPMVTDRTAAEYLRNMRVFVPRTQFPDLDEEEYYWVDLIGCKVHNLEGIYLGEVEHLMTSGAQATLVLSYADAKPQAERLIPFVSAIVQQVDTQNKRIVADWQADY